MAQFPRTEAEVAALAGPMATGLPSATTDFPAPTRPRSKAAITEASSRDRTPLQSRIDRSVSVDIPEGACYGRA